MLSHEAEFLGFSGVVDLDVEARQGEIGYVVAPEARGRGVAGPRLRLVTDWALDGLGLQRVELHIDPDNDASIRVAERCGYVREGVLRSLHFKEDIARRHRDLLAAPTDPVRRPAVTAVA